MPTPSALRDHVIDLLWSQWHELGVSTTVPRRHSDDWIDPEPLIALTALHGDLDPRLRDEAIDWVLMYGRYVSRARLKNIVSDWAAEEDQNFLVFAATVNANGDAGWTFREAKPMRFRARARSLLEDLARPALISLRIRAIFGVGARAELVRALLLRPEPAMTAADLSAETSYRKRNVLSELEPLRFAGVVKSFRAVNAERYSLARDDDLVRLVGPLPKRASKWLQTFAVLHRILQLTSSTDRSPLQRSLDAVTFLNEERALLAAADLYPPSLAAGTGAYGDFLSWATRLTEHVPGR